MSRILIFLISIVLLFSVACNRTETNGTVVVEEEVKGKAKGKNASLKKAKTSKKIDKVKKPKKEYFFDGKKRSRHYVDGIAEKLELTDIERDRLYLVYKTYHFKKQYAESDEEFERYNDMLQEAFQNIVGYDKYQEFLKLREEGGIN